MARAAALRAAPASLLSARCSPAALGSLRLWQHHAARSAAQPLTPAVCLVNQLGIRLLHATPNRRDEASTKVEEAASSNDTSKPKTKKKRSKSKKKPKAQDNDKPNDKGESEPKSKKTPAGLVEWNDRSLKVTQQRGDGDELVAHTPVSLLWLRDACPCPRCVDPHSGQKNFSTTDLPLRPELEHAQLAEDGTLELVWAADAPSGGERHTSVFPASEVATWAAEPRWQRGFVRTVDPDTLAWDRAAYEGALAAGRCRVSYDDWLAGGAAYDRALADLSQTGLIFVTGVPHGETEVERIGERIGPLQETFYGRTWDVRSKPAAENVAYTSQFLGLHQDLMYHDPVPGLQLLHCLHNDCAGGESLFSHGMRAAHELRATARGLLLTLANIRVSFAYNKNGNHYFAEHPTVLTNGRSSFPQETRWAPPFQTAFPRGACGPFSGADRKMVKWRMAAEEFQRIVEDEANMVEVKLRPGECVIFNNRVVLHGRRQFDADAGGERWLKGAYITAQRFAAACQHVMKPSLDERAAARKAAAAAAEQVEPSSAEAGDQPAEQTSPL
ncbi:hypothetical protein C8A05DRAFT_45417 [Staphylotrichum tortipilum]|uniref:Gamma-butyrobetaine dioxygenase n=1 Tax=Staphylotrichum tortipilum TaxID=2831512 RepID=A0AAN6MIG3_9PEZI|nr:hypothetical protein C8A05DRAFT_45417 [Staphylotrichum longicolle]